MDIALKAEEGGFGTYNTCEGGATISEYTESSSSTTPQWSKSYIYLGNRLLSTLTPNGSGGEVIQYHHPDRLGTRLVTNAQDASYFEQQTLPYGTALNESPNSGGTTGSTNRRFTSYDRSATTGLDYAVNRHYDSQQGRFTQVDPAGMSATSLVNPQTLNLYAYCTNDPINHTDPSGLGFLSFLKKVFGVIAKIVLVAVIVAAVVLAIVGTMGVAGLLLPLAGVKAGLLMLGLSALGFGMALGPPWLRRTISVGLAGLGIYLQGPQIIWNFAHTSASNAGSNLAGWLTIVAAGQGLLQIQRQMRDKILDKRREERQKQVCWSKDTWPIRKAAMEQIASAIGGDYNAVDSHISGTGSYNDVTEKLKKAGFENFLNLNPAHYGGSDWQGRVNQQWYHVTVGYPSEMVTRVWRGGTYNTKVFAPDDTPPWITVHCEAGKPSYLFHPRPK